METKTLKTLVLFGLLRWPEGEGEHKCIYCRRDNWALPRFGSMCGQCAVEL